MPTQVYEEALDLAVGLLEAQPIAPNEESYPLPRLKSQGKVEVRTFGVVVLENEYLQVKIAPALGGRIVSLVDRRTGRQIVGGSGTWTTFEGGPRGVELRKGIEITLDGQCRRNAMGTVAFQIEAPEDEGDPATVWIAETSFQFGLAFHAGFTLHPDTVGLHVEVRAQNRGWTPAGYNGGLLLSGADGLVFAPDPDSTFDGDTLRFAQMGMLGARQADTWSGTLIPMEGGVSAAGDGVAMLLAEGLVRVQASTYEVGQKLVLLTAEGKTLEAPVDLTPSEALEIPLDGVQPVALALLGSDGKERLRTDTPGVKVVIPNPPILEMSADLATLRRRTADLALRGVAYAAIGRLHLRQGQFGKAFAAYEEALLFNGNDPLTWWGYAVSQRLMNQDDSNARLNAHFLAPLEPMLRAEAFLGLSMEMTADPNPLVVPVADVPDDLVEVAAVLIDHGLDDQAARWIDEALRHHNLAMLHYLMAFILLRGTRMEAEAARHIRDASAATIPPLPWRPIEVQAILELHQRFPSDAALSQLLPLVGRLG